MVVIIDPQSTFWLTFGRVGHFVQGVNRLTSDKYHPGDVNKANTARPRTYPRS